MMHEDIFVGHSPDAPGAPPPPPCVTDFPLKLYPADNVAVGGSIPPGGGLPASISQVFTLPHVSISAALAKPEFGGFVYGATGFGTPGLNFIDPTNLCHGMSTSFTNGLPFVVNLVRTVWQDGINYQMAEPFGTPILQEDGDLWQFGDSTNGGHVHPPTLARRPGTFLNGYQFTSDQFLPSDEFTLRFATIPKCFAAVPINMSSVFNADVVDSSVTDVPASFDAAGHFWVLNGLYGTTLGLPVSGVLDAFQLGGPGGTGLGGANLNCIFDNGAFSSAATINLLANGQAGMYESMELLIAASGSFTSADVLVVHLHYNSGTDQIVNVRQAVSVPRFFPITDWQVTTTPVPLLAVGPSGNRNGGGFVRSNGTGIDSSAVPANSFYFSRVTFPVDKTRTLQTLTFDDYTGNGRLGIFAVSVITPALCHDGDFDNNYYVDLVDYAQFAGCMTGPLGGPVMGMCVILDFDADTDVDLRDFAAFGRAFTGPPPASP
jgi:hypothetical protein